jgi:integrase
MRPKLQPVRPGQIGDYWLSRRPNSTYWCRTWFDPNTRQTCRASLGIDDFAAAVVALAQWVTLNVGTDRAAPGDVSLGRIFGRYYERHGKYLAGSEAQRVSLAMILRAVPEGMTVASFTLDAQHEAVRVLAARGYSAGTIKRGMGAAKAAINWAWNNGDLERPVPFLRLPEGPVRERVLTIDEMAQLWDGEMPEHVRVFLALAIATAARPEALLQLTTLQGDLDRGTINLNPPGRMQTKKRRPILPMPNWLRPWIEASDGPLIAWRGKPVRKIAAAFQTVRDAAGFEPDVTAYTIRHTIATELAARSVPELEIAALMGHRMPSSQTTGRYLHVAPERLVNARKALDEIANEIGRVAARPISPETSVRASCVLLPKPREPLTPRKDGAGDGIRTHDPNLGKILPLSANLETPAQDRARTGRIRAPFQGFLVNERGNSRGICSQGQLTGRGRPGTMFLLRSSSMPDIPTDLRPATPDDVKDALSFALRFDGRKHYPRANEFMANVVAEHLLAHLERCGFVVMKKPDLPAHRSQG